MLRALGTIAGPADPRFYARGLIISMASSPEHVRAACRLVTRELGGLTLPVIPLFEQAQALEQAPSIVSGALKLPGLLEAARRHWDGYFEVMLGYSDSAKEMGSLPSRLAIASCVGRLDRVLRNQGVCPLFFHGSGGSTDRGGGSIEEQTAWLPASARRRYKATIQGEMVERTLASPEIAYRRFEQIAGQAQRGGHGVRVSREARAFASVIERSYKEKVASPEFLELVQKVTAYPYLSALKIGSRPAKRGSFASVASLRAIPWVLCWTQARVLFPSWWGVGSAWRSGRVPLRALKSALARDPVFASYVKILGSTLARIELPVFRLMMERSDLEPECRERAWRELDREYRAAIEFVRAVSGKRHLIWYRPWLEASIGLRSAMIHPLNLVQIIALKKGYASLIRETVTGIASGMMTTG
jgi:phosphoenolpyruvate carboxylase